MVKSLREIESFLLDNDFELVEDYTDWSGRGFKFFERDGEEVTTNLFRKKKEKLKKEVI